MKKFLFFIFSSTIFNLQAEHFKNSMSVKPFGVEYIVEMRLERIGDEGLPELIAAPCFVCKPGDEPTQLVFGTNDKTDFLSVEVKIPAPLKKVHASLLMKEKDQVVFSFDNSIQLD